MEIAEIIKKWELILQQDIGKNIAYDRNVIAEIISDFKRADTTLFPMINSGGRIEQYVINTNKEELDNLKYFRQRYYDFWEWYEKNYPHTEKELWDEFEGIPE